MVLSGCSFHPSRRSAEDLATKFLTDRLTVEKEIGNRWFLLTGTVVSNENNILTLKASDQRVKVTCEFLTGIPGQEKQDARLRACTPGPEVKVIGKLGVGTVREIPEVGTNLGLVVEPGS